MMTAARMKILEDQQTSIARKVFAAVPIAEPWTSRAIAGEMRRLSPGNTSDLSTVEGCLNSLVEAGLVCERSGHFQRVKVRQTSDEGAEPMTLRSVGSAPGPRQDVLSRLASLATRLRILADEIDAIALDADAEIAASKVGDAKLRQFKELLNNL